MILPLQIVLQCFMHKNKQVEICENNVKIWASLRIISFRLLKKKSYTDLFLFKPLSAHEP